MCYHNNRLALLDMPHAVVGTNCRHRVLSPRSAPSEITFLVQEHPEGGYVASALGYSIVTQADDYPKLRIAIRDAVDCHFEEAMKPEAMHLR